MTDDRKPTPDRKPETPVADSTDFGQPVASPGTRGGTTPYGGVVRGGRKVGPPDTETGNR